MDGEVRACDNVTIVQAALKAGGNPNRGYEEGLAALHACISWGWNPAHLPVVKALIDAKADVDQPDNRGRTPFWFANHAGALDVIKLLHPIVKNHHPTDNNGWTALDYAIRLGGHDTVELMLKLGVDPTVGRIKGPHGDRRMHAILKGEKYVAPPADKADADAAATPSKPKVAGEL